MDEQFTHIATILFEHNYFSNGVFEPTEVTVQAETLRTLKNLSVLVKPFAGGFHLLASQLEGLRAVQEDFRFEIRCSDPYFINYTELAEFNPSRDLFYFTNKETHRIADSSKLSLHAGYVGKENILTSHKREINLDTFNQNSNYTFSSSAGVLDSTQVQQIDPEANKFILTNVPEGVINAYENGIFSERFYYTTNSLWQKPIGIIDISLQTLYKQYVGSDKTVQYTIQWDARQTYWEYYVTKDKLASFNNIAIINQNQDQVFRYIGTKEDFLIFRTVAPHHLSQSQEEGFQLVHNFTQETASNRTYTTVIKQLSIPSPNQLQPNSDHPTDPTAPLYSHLYIYI